MSKSKPEKKFSCGLVNVAVFLNQTTDRPFRSLVVSKAYKNPNSNKWEYGSSFTAADAIVLRRLLDMAVDYMIEADVASRKPTPAEWKSMGDDMLDYPEAEDTPF